MIKNNKLKKLLTKDPDYLEPQTINIPKALIEITTVLDTCSEAMTLKIKFTTLKEKVLAKVKERITELK